MSQLLKNRLKEKANRKKQEELESRILTAATYAVLNPDRQTRTDEEQAQLGRLVGAFLQKTGKNVLVQAHEYGQLYEKAAVLVLKKNCDNPKAADWYKRGVTKFAEVNPVHFNAWLSKWLLSRSVLTLPQPKLRFEEDHAEFRTFCNRNPPVGPGQVAKPKSNASPPENPPITLVAKDAPQRESGFIRPHPKRPKSDTQPPPPNARTLAPPPRLDPEVLKVKNAFYSGEGYLDFPTTPKLSFIVVRDAATTRLLSNKLQQHSVYKADFGVPPTQAHDSQGHDLQSWKDWAKQYGVNVVGDVWQNFFKKVSESRNANDGKSIFSKGSLRTGIDLSNLGSLHLKYVRHGTYNVVFEAGPQTASLYQHMFPPHIRLKLNQVVFRVPILAHDDSNTIGKPVLAAARELTNMLEAAEGGFGPPVYVGAAIAVTESVGELFTISEKLSGTIRDVFHPTLVNDHDVEFAKSAVTRTMERLADVLFAYSVRGVIHLDASPANFMVVMHTPASSVHSSHSPSISAIRNVYAIDLDPCMYRPIVADGDSQQRDGWVCAWLYNALFLSAQIKYACHALVFKVWIEQRVAPNSQRSLLDQIHITAAALKKSKPSAWPFSIRWQLPISNWKFDHDLSRSTTDDKMSKEILQFCQHYFITAPDSDVKFTLEELRCDPGNKRANTMYNRFHLTHSIPTMSFFAGKLAPEGHAVETTELLVDVLDQFLFATSTGISAAASPAPPRVISCTRA